MRNQAHLIHVHLKLSLIGSGEIPIALPYLHSDTHGCILRVTPRPGGVMDKDLRLQLSEEGADTERLAVLTGYLRAELLRLDVENVRALQADEVPAGARAFGADTVGALLVAFGQSVEGLQSVVSVIRDWLRRGEGTGRAVRLELGGDALELSQASAADQERLIELFIRRHATGEGTR
jgi:hypothetical protein